MANQWAQATQAKLMDVVLDMSGGVNYLKTSGPSTAAYGATQPITTSMTSLGFNKGNTVNTLTTGSPAFIEANHWAAQISANPTANTFTEKELLGLWSKYQKDPYALFQIVAGIDKLAASGSDISRAAAQAVVKKLTSQYNTQKAQAEAKRLAALNPTAATTAIKPPVGSSGGTSTGTPGTGSGPTSTTPMTPTKTSEQIKAEAEAALTAQLGTSVQGQALGVSKGISNAVDEARQLVARGMISHYANAPMIALAPMSTIKGLDFLL